MSTVIRYVCLALAICVTQNLLAAEPPIVGEIVLSPSDTPLTSENVTLSIAASSPAGLPLSYAWDFGDGSAQGKGATVTHVFAQEDIYIVTVDVSDGVNPTVTSLAFVESIAPPAATDAVGVNSGDAVVNPDNGLGVTVATDQGSFIQLAIDDSQFSSTAQSREANDIKTEWGDLSRAATGRTPRHNYDAEGIYTATVSVIESASGSAVGRARKTVVVSGEAVGAQPKVTHPPPMDRRDVTVTKMKGKFNFTNATKTDLVSVNFEIDLPEGLDLSVSREITLSLGNITEKVSIDPKGKGAGSLFKKVRLKYPRLKKGETLTPANLIAKVQAQVASADLDNSGFDTEGITPRAKSAAPKIQIALLLDGVAYADQSEVQFKVSPKGDVGIIGRSASRRTPLAP